MQMQMQIQIQHPQPVSCFPIYMQVTNMPCFGSPVRWGEETKSYHSIVIYEIVILKTAMFARRNQRIVNDKAMILKAELPMFAYYSNAPDSPFCPACTHNRSHTVDLKSRYTNTNTNTNTITDCTPLIWSQGLLAVFSNHHRVTFSSQLFFGRMAFLHLESKQLSSDQATTRDFFCQVPFGF